MSDLAIKKRVMISAMFLALAMVGLGMRLAFLHLGDHEDVRRKAESRRTMLHKILAGRGVIYDCSDNILAMNLGVKDVCADPFRIVQSNVVLKTALRLSECLELPTDEVFVRLNRPNRRFEYVKRYVIDGVADALKNEKLYGIFFRDVTVRHYPHKGFMCHILGFVNYQGVGSLGVEQRLDRLLRGTPGFVEGRVNAMREELYWKRIRYEAPQEGANVYLSIDQNVQYIAEKALDGIIEKHNSKGAWVIVQRVRTGEILAMATRPCFDPNKFRTTGSDVKLNRAIGYTFEPGSTFKAVVVSAALNEGIVTPETVIDCENGSWFYKGRILRDYHSYNKLTVADVIKKSSNIGAAKIALMLGEKRFEKYLKAYGIGAVAGIDLPGEERGILHSASKWSRISATRIAIGQGVSVTALQMLGVYSCIANDGFLMRPYIVKRVVNKDGITVRKCESEAVSRPITTKTAATMRRLLARVTENGGTGRRARVAGYKVAGKTGTAQKAIKGGYSDSKHMASFVGFLPARDPEIAVIVVVDEPQPFHTGGRVAGPAFSQIADQVVRYLEIPPVRHSIVMSEK
ncbi:MAG: penicillin-binding protein 2 [Kiritimatiellae bacterium]|nr:penicillin-binding protein 2 [Kiritimatiellia bacterium]